MPAAKPHRTPEAGAEQSSAALAKPSHDSSSNEKGVDLGTQVLEGVQVKGIRFTSFIPAGAIGNFRPIGRVTEVWRSPELGLPILSKTSDAVTGERVRRYSKIVMDVEVDVSKFAIPSDYQVERESIQRPLSGAK